MEDARHPIGGDDYPRTFQEVDDWFASDVKCRESVGRLRWAEWLRGFRLRRDRRTLGNVLRTASMPRMRVGDDADGGHDVPGYAQAVARGVFCDVVRHQSEEWRRRLGFAAGAGVGQLRNGLDLAP